MKFHEHVDTTYPKINYKSQLLTRQTTRDMAHTKPPNGSNSESRWGARNLINLLQIVLPDIICSILLRRKGVRNYGTRVWPLVTFEVFCFIQYFWYFLESERLHPEISSSQFLKYPWACDLALQSWPIITKMQWFPGSNTSVGLLNSQFSPFCKCSWPLSGRYGRSSAVTIWTKGLLAPLVTDSPFIERQLFVWGRVSVCIHSIC